MKGYGWVIILVLMFIAIGILHGCTTETAREDTTGKMTCVGYCELDVSNKQQSVSTTEPGGKTTEEFSKETGLSAGIREKKETINE